MSLSTEWRVVGIVPGSFTSKSLVIGGGLSGLEGS